MKKNIILMIFLLLAFHLSTNAQKIYQPEMLLDSIELKAKELNDVDFKFKIIIKNHLKKQKNELHLINRKNNIVVISIGYIDNYKSESNKNNDSIIVSSQFKNNDFDLSYSILVETVNKKKPSIKSILNYQKFYIYKYKSWDVLFVTNLDIEFHDEGEVKTLIYYYKNIGESTFNYPFSSVYTLSNYEIREISSKRLYYLSTDVLKPEKRKGIYWSNKKDYDFGL